MNVYDFDGTIYDGDSSKDFYFYCLMHNRKVIHSLPCQFSGFMRFFLRKIDKTKMKEDFFSFLKYVPDVDSTVVSFWKQNEHKVKQWYMKQRKSDDVIISASPEFLLKPVCRNLEIHSVIASKVDCHTGKFMSANCRGKEKVLRFREVYPKTKIDKFYSDSKSDLPMAKQADKPFLVKGGHITQWKTS